MMASSNGTIFRVTGDRWIPRTKGQWRGALMFPLICAWINGRVSNPKASDVRRHRAHFDVTVMDERSQWRHIIPHISQHWDPHWLVASSRWCTPSLSILRILTDNPMWVGHTRVKLIEIGKMVAVLPTIFLHRKSSYFDANFPAGSLFLRV